MAGDGAEVLELPFCERDGELRALAGLSNEVFLPLILKSCGILPLFMTVKTTVPCGTLSFESLNLNSVAVTVTAAALACDRAPSAGAATNAEHERRGRRPT